MSFKTTTLLGFGFLVGCLQQPNWLSAQESEFELGRQDHWSVQHHDSKASFRGVFVVDENVVWVSGSKGTVLRSIDGAKTLESVGPQDATELDFRDIHAFDADNAILLTAGTPARTYRTSDGGKTWKITFEHARDEAFFDAMSFWDTQNGIAFSDPIDGKLLIIKTTDAGQTWTELDREYQPHALEGEGGFAASGTCLCTIDGRVFIGLGGERKKDDDPANARILQSNDQGKTWMVRETPMKSAAASGVFSMVFANRDHGVAVGGTYNEPADASNNICITEDGGQTWVRPKSTPRGYRSAVAVQRTAAGVRLVAVSRAGSDFSIDFGRTWQKMDDETFYALSFSTDGKLGVAVGADGKVGILKSDEK